MHNEVSECRSDGGGFEELGMGGGGEPKKELALDVVASGHSCEIANLQVGSRQEKGVHDTSLRPEPTFVYYSFA